MIFFFFVNFYHRELQGVIVTLDEGGYLHCAYLGTDPSMMVTPAPEARDINYEVSTRVFICLCFFVLFFFCECHRRYNVDRAIFNWVSKIIRDCTGFALRRSVIGSGNLAPISQSIRCKLKPITTWSLAFSSVFPRSRQFSCVYPGLSLAIKGKKIYRLAIAITLVLV